MSSEAVRQTLWIAVVAGVVSLVVQAVVLVEICRTIRKIKESLVTIVDAPIVLGKDLSATLEQNRRSLAIVIGNANACMSSLRRTTDRLNALFVEIHQRVLEGMAKIRDSAEKFAEARATAAMFARSHRSWCAVQTPALRSRLGAHATSVFTLTGLRRWTRG
jgi:hypothetical protein